MEIEERLKQLEDAHRELAALHIALRHIALALLPLITASRADIRNRLLFAYDIQNDNMRHSGMPDDFQRAARAEFDVLANAIQTQAVNA